MAALWPGRAGLTPLLACRPETLREDVSRETLRRTTVIYMGGLCSTFWSSVVVMLGVKRLALRRVVVLASRC